jgi:hypothetical protein
MNNPIINDKFQWMQTRGLTSLNLSCLSARQIMFIAGTFCFHIPFSSIRHCVLGLALAVTFDSMIIPLAFQSWSLTTVASAPPHELMEACSVLSSETFSVA